MNISLQLFSNSCDFKGKHFKHIYTDHPRFITGENIKWGFCLPYKKVKKLTKGNYTVNIKTQIKKEDMLSVFLKHKGTNSKMLLFVSHLDHPFQANDGIAGSVAIKKLKQKFHMAH